MAFLVAAGICYAAGALTMVMLVIFGFAAFGLTFVGMMVVLPIWSHAPSVVERQKPAPVVELGFSQIRLGTSKAPLRSAYKV
jgi:hypothetical protein